MSYENDMKKINEEADYCLRLPMTSLVHGLENVKSARNISFAQAEVGYLKEKLEKLTRSIKYIEELIERFIED